MRFLAWLAAVLLIVAGLHAVDWSMPTTMACISLAGVLMTWVVADPKDRRA